MRAGIGLFLICVIGCASTRPILPATPRPPRERPATLAILSAPTPEPAATTVATPKQEPTIQQVAAAESPRPRAIEQLHADAQATFAEATSFVSRLRRRESPNGKPRPEELILFKERKDPYGIHMKWIGQEANGREVLYVRGKFGDKLHVITATGDVPFTQAGQRLSFARDSMFVKAANPNHDITDAGMSSYLRDLTQLYGASRNPQSGVAVRSLGIIQRPEFPDPVEGVEITLPANRDPDVPRGGTRQVFYCTKCKLPVLFLCSDDVGREQNYNCYDRIQTNLKLDNDDFDPDRIWGKRTPVSNASLQK